MYEQITSIMGETASNCFDIIAHAPGADGRLPLTDDLLRNAPSGDLFGMSQNVGMGWKPGELNGKQYLILSTQGGIRNEDGSPAALGYHTGHWEVGLLMKAAAEELSSRGESRLLDMSAIRVTADLRGQPACLTRFRTGTMPLWYFAD